MDLVGYSRATFETILADYRAFAARIGLTDITPIPLSAVHGDNVIAHGPNMPWYAGPTLLQHLESVEVDADSAGAAFRCRCSGSTGACGLPWLCRPDVSGSVKKGDRIRVLPSGREGYVARIVTAGGDLQAAVSGQSVTLTLDSEIDVSAAMSSPRATRRRRWPTSSRRPSCGCTMSHAAGACLPDEGGPRTVSATSARSSTRSTSTPGAHGRRTAELNDIGVCELELDRAIRSSPTARIARSRVYPHRPPPQRHRGRRPHQLRAAALAERALAGA